MLWHTALDPDTPQSRNTQDINIIVQQVNMIYFSHLSYNGSTWFMAILAFFQIKMAADMDPEEMEEWRTIFNLFDVDGDESITCEVKHNEVDKWMDKLNIGKWKFNVEFQTKFDSISIKIGHNLSLNLCTISTKFWCGKSPNKSDLNLFSNSIKSTITCCGWMNQIMWKFEFIQYFQFQLKMI